MQYHPRSKVTELLRTDHREQGSGGRHWWPATSLIITGCADLEIYNCISGNEKKIIWVVCTYQALEEPLIARPITVSQWVELAD